MSEARWVVGDAARSPWLLNTDPYPSVERAERAIEWQRVGQGQFDPPDYWKILTTDELKKLAPTMTRSPYTIEAWDAFLKRLDAIDG